MAERPGPPQPTRKEEVGVTDSGLQQGEGVGMEVMELESKVSPATAGTPLAELEVPAEMAGRDILASLVRVVV